MIFVTPKLQEKCRAQRMDICVVFIDLSMSLNTMNRQDLWEIMRLAECPIESTNIVRDFHNQMTAAVSIAGEETVPFHVVNGVKQGCVLTPVIFNVFLAASSYLSRESFTPETGS